MLQPTPNRQGKRSWASHQGCKVHQQCAQTSKQTAWFCSKLAVSLWYVDTLLPTMHICQSFCLVLMYSLCLTFVSPMYARSTTVCYTCVCSLWKANRSTFSVSCRLTCTSIIATDDELLNAIIMMCQWRQVVALRVQVARDADKTQWRGMKWALA